MGASGRNQDDEGWGRRPGAFDVMLWALDTARTPSAGAKAVLVVLASYADSTTGVCFPSLANIARRASVSRNTARARINDLVAAGLVAQSPRFRANAGCTSNQYVLLHSAEAIARAAGKAESAVPAPKRTPAVVSAEGDRGTRLASDWQPGETLLVFGASLGFSNAEVLGELLDEFRDFWLAVPGPSGHKLDWDATFRNNLRKLRKRHHRTRPELKPNAYARDLLGTVPRECGEAAEAGPISEPPQHRLAGLLPLRLRRVS